MSNRIDNIIEDIKEQYLESDNGIPWIIGFSGGKDSTVVLTLVWKALLSIREEKGKDCMNRPVYVVNNDTLVENPIISDYVIEVLDIIKKAAINQELPIKVQVTYPKLEDSFWISFLGKGQPGSSLGGARPKASVIDTDKTLYVAKFPSRKDDYDAGLWEHFSHLLAAKAGINAAKTKVIATGEKYHTLLSERFDRTKDGKRIHFASAMTLLGLNDGDNATTGYGYLEIVDFIIQNCTDVDRNLQELYRRVAFNICIGNSDDHFRNHGFLLTAKGWSLSPAYDMNPTLNAYQSLLISATSNKADLGILLDACGDYMLNCKIAEKIISEVTEAVKGWRELAVRLSVSKREMDLFAGVLDERRMNNLR